MPTALRGRFFPGETTARAHALRRRGAADARRNSPPEGPSHPGGRRNGSRDRRAEGPALTRPAAWRTSAGRTQREERLVREGTPEDFDLFVIGGGINGCGIARDAAGRGLRVVLFEQDDLAQRDLVGLDQADPRRPALSRVLRVPAGARGADRARGAAAASRRTSSGRCASCCRTTTGLRPALAAAARPVPLRPSRRAQDPAARRARST